MKITADLRYLLQMLTLMSRPIPNLLEVSGPLNEVLANCNFNFKCYSKHWIVSNTETALHSYFLPCII